MPPTITWFRNGHEHSLHYFKFGLMQLAKGGEIRYREIPNDQAGAMLPVEIRSHEHRRTVAVRVDDGSRSILLILDGEDSIFQTSYLIEHCDLYFSCTFRRRFFQAGSFDLELPWQTECEVAPYKKKYQELQHRFSNHLHKARPLMPIGPGMEMQEHHGFLRRKMGSIRHRISKLRAPWIDWRPQFEHFQRRWSFLMGLRELEPEYDVVLKDSLWGWPRHRVALHRELQRLSSSFRIESELNFREVFDFECGDHVRPCANDFPIISGKEEIADYEVMLAKSRLGVFATGFHYGCRNIVTLAWLLGLRTVSDPFSFESIYGFDELGGLGIHRSGDWRELRQQLEEARNEISSARLLRQRTFDRMATPIHGAKWILEESLRR